jgi:pimeloyl-ACP methyl ester carboxylesterase
MPVLITWGANDPSAILPIGIKLFEMIRAKTKHVEMHIFNNVAHFHYREIPDQWNRVVMNFIEMNA